ncbi:EcsC family protein [Methylocapsa sp. S129]|uniref:EcsC family protein n=1 Tax=Methylocapsa sp. S129 TaxID=1641869 RepID=UPI00131CD0EB|nr:EcsC family protein [Methylocapsa sp. S129]
MMLDVMPTHLTEAETDQLRAAVDALEGNGFSSRLTNLLGRQVEMVGRSLPSPVRKVVARATETALRAALRVAISTIDAKTPPKAASGMHKALAAASGAAGGAFGLAAVAVELPVSTTIMLRSIAQIAREQGEDLTQPEAALACVEVFALGGRAPGEAAALEGSYFAIRSVLAKTVSESARFILQRGLTDETAPVLVRLVVQIAARFGLVVSQKLAAQAIPVIGALGGAAVNLAFTEHFQNIARGHFTVRRLERAYGAEAVRFDYERLRNEKPGRK